MRCAYPGYASPVARIRPKAASGKTHTARHHPATTAHLNAFPGCAALIRATRAPVARIRSKTASGKTHTTRYQPTTTAHPSAFPGCAALIWATRAPRSPDNAIGRIRENPHHTASTGNHRTAQIGDHRTLASTPTPGCDSSRRNRRVVRHCDRSPVDDTMHAWSSIAAPGFPTAPSFSP